MQKALAHASEVAVETFQAMATVRSFANEDGVAARYRQCLHQTHQLEKQDAVLYTVSAWTSGVRDVVAPWHGGWGTGWHGGGGTRVHNGIGVVGHGDTMAWGLQNMGTR